MPRSEPSSYPMTFEIGKPAEQQAGTNRLGRPLSSSVMLSRIIRFWQLTVTVPNALRNKKLPFFV
jgi:hypothetical protein